MNYRRLYVPGGTYFFTLVTYNRRQIFANPEAVELLREAFRYTRKRNSFEIIASVILPDHLHVIWSDKDGSSDYSTVWRLIKSHFTRYWCVDSLEDINLSRLQKGEKHVWQRRFWEHLIRDEKDLENHIEYIHYNPVKHGLASTPSDWQYSSFMKFVYEGIYPIDWRADTEKLLAMRCME